MKTQVIITFLSLITLSSWSKEEYPGVVKLEFYEEYEFHEDNDKNKVSDTLTFEFFTCFNSKLPAHQLSVYSIIKEFPTETILNRTNIEWLNPMILQEKGDFLIYLTCKKIKGNWMEVVINEKTKETLWIKKAKSASFISWAKLNLDNSFITITTEQDIYLMDDTTSEKRAHHNDDSFKIVKVKGDWMEIDNSCDICNSHDQIHKTGWIQFRDLETLKIKFLLN